MKMQSVIDANPVPNPLDAEGPKDTKGAASWCKSGAGTLENFRSAATPENPYGGGPRFFRRGRKVLYWPSDLDAWLRSQPQGRAS
ncbi:hypothetical protein [Tsukamurella paurometabola]|uniref:Helix-turn-helix domain-containing protein n=1 Tax=Tsukamurella paurometabola TaxID=2061 RepID=A0ABS5NEL0_TSUPA|nr:hypothetical protein [Tsukamurella paurometabola]MBS4102746.1 hypothetical protein [Tsukamurella paurometabola]